ncbi:MAG TPA: sigma-70 family RNA polymerase sigma factor [Actinomycetota bacterium]|nr:sigma-70 family RNA polymerase sigma factor [Actinomycetota bacterium]
MTSRNRVAARSSRVRLPPFMELLEEHGDVVYRYLRVAVGPDDAEDCLQETLLSALRAYPRLTDDRNLRGWLLTIAKRKAYDEHRSRRRRPAPSERLPEAVSDPPTEAEDGLWRAVGELPPKQREAVVYRFVCDLPHREIGELMGSTESAARRNVYEGLRALREVWR